MSDASSRTKPTLWIGLEAARANLVPGLMVQGVMLAIVLGYYLHPGTREWLNALAQFKAGVGLPFAGVMAAVAGAVLPELLKIAYFQRGRVTRGNVRTLAITVPVWAYNGMVVDVLYRLQGMMFGNATDVRTVTIKVAMDQFVFNPFYAAIINTIIYDLLARGYTWGNLRSCCTLTYYRERVFPTLIATWGVWIPVVAIIYSLPADLQIPLFGLALTFWALMLAYMNTAKPGQGMTGKEKLATVEVGRECE